ncbi:hypothetical protein [Paraburkholderia sp. MM5384-R2]|uniref:hypothetical protein n=1 Tax=Paraburkholderia sp. MM5384-R2 TaxID=2723097 RepID=UPI0016128EC1|nr:hypothetical protein [Paraburkholderia sp. MM5384-R2]MBB5497414.1 hypothetical protein [Paraburkholderia sp. MM5384-R2]
MGHESPRDASRRCRKRRARLGLRTSTPKLSTLARKRRNIFTERTKVSPVWLIITNSNAPRQLATPRENAYMS